MESKSVKPSIGQVFARKVGRYRDCTPSPHESKKTPAAIRLLTGTGSSVARATIAATRLRLRKQTELAEAEALF